MSNLTGKAAKAKNHFAKDTAGESLSAQRENAMYGKLRNSPAFKCVWALLLNKRDGVAFSQPRLNRIAEAICEGDDVFLNELKAAIDHFRPHTLHNRQRLENPLRYHLVEFAQNAWPQYAGRPPYLTEIKAYLEPRGIRLIKEGEKAPVKSGVLVFTEGTVRDVWKKEMLQKLSVGRPELSQKNRRLLRFLSGTADVSKDSA